MIDVLRKIPLFSSLNEQELEAISRLITTLHVPKKQIVVQEGEEGDALYAILNGTVKISSYTSDGCEVVLSILGKGAVFGEMSLLDSQPRSATVTTMEDSTLGQIRRSDFRKLLLEQPDISLKLLSELVSRLRRTSQILERISSMDVPHRLYAHLLDHCRRFGHDEGGGWYSAVFPTHQLLADQLSTSRETISRVMSTLKKEGILNPDSGRGKMRVDVNALETLLESIQ